MDAETQGERYLKAFLFHGLPMVAVAAAVDEVTNTAKSNRWPTPGQLSEIAKKYVPRPDGERNHPEFGGDRCQFCGMMWFWAGYQVPGRSLPVLRARCACPASGSGWWTPAARALRDDNPRMALRPADYETNPRYRTRTTREMI